METKLLKALEDKPKREKIRAQKELGRQGDQWDEKTVRYLKRLRRDHAPAVETLRAAYYEYCGAQLAYDLGDHGCAKLFPDVQPPESLTWSGYRKRAFERIRSRQRADGGWGDGGSEVHATALTLMILRLEDEALPALSR